MVNDKILIAREARRNIIKNLAIESDVVSLKANVMGWIKNIPESFAVISSFSSQLKNLGAKDITFYDSEDGLTVFCKVDNGIAFKQKAVELETVHPLGRLVDIDVTLKGQENSLTRKELRKCFLCDNPAFVCGRNRTHTTAELVNFFIDKSQEYFVKEIAKIIEQSMMAELEMENKFGLVTPSSKGAHKDLDYSLMKKAVKSIANPLAKAFSVGLTVNIEDGLIDKLVDLGVWCENQMFKETKGVNAYKGFIFVGGIVLATLGQLIKNRQGLNDFTSVCSTICKQFKFPQNTFGEKAYLQGIGGVRKCSMDGFSIVLQAEKLIDNLPLWQILTFIVGNIEDSVLYKRSKSLEGYNYFKQLISSVDNELLRANVTKECIENNISIGGSADILIASIMLNKLKSLFYI